MVLVTEGQPVQLKLDLDGSLCAVREVVIADASRAEFQADGVLGLAPEVLFVEDGGFVDLL